MLQTELFLKSSAAWASTSAYNASTIVHQGQRQDSEEYDPEEE